MPKPLYDPVPISRAGETPQPFQVRARCGHIVIRRMRESTAGVAYGPDVILDAPNGRECDACEKERGA